MRERSWLTIYIKTVVCENTRSWTVSEILKPASLTPTIMTQIKSHWHNLFINWFNKRSFKLYIFLINIVSLNSSRPPTLPAPSSRFVALRVHKCCSAPCGKRKKYDFLGIHPSLYWVTVIMRHCFWLSSFRAMSLSMSTIYSTSVSAWKK